MLQIKELAKKCFGGEVTLHKVTLWLIGGVCFLGGIVYGLKSAPITHGVMIGSNNGNNNGNNSGSGPKQEDKEENASGEGT